MKPLIETSDLPGTATQSEQVEDCVFEDYSGETNGEKYMQAIFDHWKEIRSQNVKVKNEIKKANQIEETLPEDSELIEVSTFDTSKPEGWYALKFFVVLLEGKEYSKYLLAEKNFIVRLLFPKAEVSKSRNELDAQRRADEGRARDEADRVKRNAHSRSEQIPIELENLAIVFEIENKAIGKQLESSMQFFRIQQDLGFSREELNPICFPRVILKDTILNLVGSTSSIR
jgi:hypothetical protein